MKKQYFRFQEADKPDQVPGLLAGTHGLEQTVAALRAGWFTVEEVTARQAARIRQQQSKKEALARKIQAALRG